MARRRYPHPATPARSRIMRSIRASGTAPEAEVRSRLHRAGLRFRKNATLRLPSGSTRPDIVFPRLKLAVFIDGCFWHGCPRHATHPRHNAWYWAPKLRQNRDRDARSTRELRSAGWLVRRFWEHVPPARVAQQVQALVQRLVD
ncbi:MAG: very short patch repair endonuclease [Candidatus Sericytochromatia bacterium]|nr:very short patch repair endonuclease [Candidatus Sericytochromatia bacterium]